MVFSTGGIKISDLRLINLPPSWKTNFKFQIVIKCDSETRTSTKGAFRKSDPCVIWNESIVFEGEFSDNTLLVFMVVRIHRFFPISPNNTIGSCECHTTELLKAQSNLGFCTLDIAGKCQLTFKIKKSSDVVLDVVKDASAALVNMPDHAVLAKAATATSTAVQIYGNNEKTWLSFIDKFQVFMGVIDDISEINPYVKMAWSILSVIPKTIIKQKNRNDQVEQLCEKLKDIYDYITDTKRLQELTKTQSKTLCVLVQQTIECAYFIREYSMKNIVKTIAKGISGSIDDKIQAFNNKFDHLKNVMTDSVNLETSIVTLRMSEKINEHFDFTLLQEMPYDPDAGFYPNKQCLPGTRQTLIDEILEWINNDKSPQILVLSGQAGAGKSAVAHTIAGMFQKQNRLGSMFCFNRSYADRRNYLFSTISRDLADGDTLWRKELVNVIHNNSAVRRKKDVETQFDELIVKPSKHVTTTGPVVIVVDALDESGERHERKEILEFLLGRWSEFPKNYRLLVTTRPEQDIETQCKKFNTPCKRMDDIDGEETRRDIRVYVSNCLKSISSELDDIDRNWRDILANRAENLFQWAATVCGFIDTAVTLPELITENWKTCISKSSSSLYGLYHQIILRQPESQYLSFKQKFKTVVGAIVTAREPLSMNTLQNILVDINIREILLPFSSFFSGVCDPSESTPVQPIHTSLFDFFAAETIAEKPNDYYIDVSDRSRMTLACLKLMNQMLCFNICKLETSHMRNQEVPNIDSRVEESIPLHLSYSCRFWSFHLQSSAHSKELVCEIRELMDDKLLYYFEALSLLKMIDRGCVAMREIMNWCKDEDGTLAVDAMDIWEFGYDFGDAMTESTPHLYLSALPFTPSDSFVSRKYLLRYPRLFTFDIGQPVGSTHKNGITQRHASAGAPVALAFSPKGRYIATGSDRGDFWVWDYLTGDRLLTKIRSEYVNQHRLFDRWHGVSDVVFSPDGELIYCCFYSGDILVWNMRTKVPIMERYEEVAGVECHFCTISSDGCFMVWCTSKETYVFDRKSHESVETFKGSFTFTSAAISPNGDWIALYRDPKHDRYLREPGLTAVPLSLDIRMLHEGDVHIWNTRNHETLDVVSRGAQGHLALTDSYVAFQNNRGSIDIRDLQKNTKVAETGCEGRIRCFCFSPDDQYLLSTSDSTYSIWNVSTGELISQSHVDNRIFCMGFSHDSRSIALRTPDGAIHVRQWDTSIEPSHPRRPDIQGVREIWLRGAYLIIRYWNTFHRDCLQISKIATTNTIVFAVELSESNRLVSVSPDEKDVRVAYVNASRGLCLWDEEGEIVVSGSDSLFSTHLCLEKYLVFTGLKIIKIWDIRTNQIKSEVPSSCWPIIISDRENPLISVRDTQFAILDGDEGEVWECESGDKVAQLTFDMQFSREYYMTVACSASGEYIICMSEEDIDILDASTGAWVASIPCSRHDPARRLSPNGKYLTWRGDDEVILLDTDTQAGVSLKEPSLRQPIEKLWFSNDVNFMITASNADVDKKTGLLNIWDMRSRNTIIKSIRYPFNPENIENLVLSNRHLADSIKNSSRCSVWDLDTYETMSTLYSAPPVTGLDASDGSCTEGTPVSNRTETLDYALMAWNKASLPAFAHMDNGWVLGLQGELLFWVPENRRKHFWFPCMMHMPHKDITKLNFTNFVHGSSWTNCHRPRND